MRRFYSSPETFIDQHVTFGLDETRHLRDVLRLQSGARIAVFDGTGREFECEVETVGKKETRLTVIGEIKPPCAESQLGLTLAAALMKGDKFDLVIQKSVELGVTAFVPLITQRCDVRLNDSAKKLERWRKIALEASKQCGRATLMTIGEPIEFRRFVTTFESLVLFSERGGEPFPTRIDGNKITALVGPEGGWDDSELEFAAGNNVKIVTLGGRILRTETAAIAVTALLQHRFGDLG